ncbi:conjugative transposon protein TraM [Wocania ichthyoenteri]|uniref:conjugative transposon protein TraM n=1 Tax=Wocania ichthyoenteri TaxID=1230531 RepID=UPI00053DD277|nr:conjugative transposon protein TraM [Wocania ichthyoenteri]
MKLEKNKIVFAVVILGIITFMAIYAITAFGNDESPTIENNQIPVPKLEDGQKEYDSKLDALNDLKEVRQTNAPSIYDERLLDSTGVYDPDLLEKEKMRIVDSIYQNGRINYSDSQRYLDYPLVTPDTNEKSITSKIDSVIPETKPLIVMKELGLEHQLFFSSTPIKNKDEDTKTDALIYVSVNGNQIVKTFSRLELRLVKPAIINGNTLPRNTNLYGFISFKPNRTLIHITNINHQEVSLKAFDLQDGNEGIYVENSFQAEASQEVLGDVVDDVNIAGVPQVSGVKRIFQRNNRNVKVTITDNYKLILKSQ